MGDELVETGRGDGPSGRFRALLTASGWTPSGAAMLQLLSHRERQLPVLLAHSNDRCRTSGFPLTVFLGGC
jgi:hypothetical protein